MWCRLLLCFPLLASVLGRTRHTLINIRGQGMINGKEVSVTRTQRAQLYLGIPYAAPPLGELRFSPPVTNPWPTWTGILNATEFKPSCMQLAHDFKTSDRLNLASRAPLHIQFSEDCLYLNVFTPDGSAPKGLGWPVMIWLHPGDFSVGSPSIWDATMFAIRQKVIVVTAAYRLNIFGFLTALDGLAPGNYGLLDQLAVMDWVQEHIVHFNGSAGEVTLAGHSAGAISATLHMASTRSRGRFHRVVAMSGNMLEPGALKVPSKETLLEIAETFYCDDAPLTNLLACLRKADRDGLLNKAAELGGWGPVLDSAFPNVTEPFLRAEPEVALETSLPNQVPVVLGYAEMEEAEAARGEATPSAFREAVRRDVLLNAPPVKDNETCELNEDLLVDAVLFHYSPGNPGEADPSLFRRRFVDCATDRQHASSAFKLAQLLSSRVPTYLYRFDYKMKTSTFADERDWVTVGRQYELPLVWGVPYWTTLQPQVVWAPLDKKTSDVVMALLGNFTKHASPVQNKKAINWEEFTEDNPRLFIVDKNFEMSDPTTFDYKSVRFWNEYYPKIVEAANRCCNATEAGENLRPQAVLLATALFSTAWF